MNERKTANSPAAGKKLWAAPALQIIPLGSAANTTIHTIGDGKTTRKS